MSLENDIFERSVEAARACKLWNITEIEADIRKHARNSVLAFEMCGRDPETLIQDLETVKEECVPEMQQGPQSAEARAAAYAVIMADATIEVLRRYQNKELS